MTWRVCCAIWAGVSATTEFWYVTDPSMLVCLTCWHIELRILTSGIGLGSWLYCSAIEIFQFCLKREELLFILVGDITRQVGQL